jgi:hypothetical protein
MPAADAAEDVPGSARRNREDTETAKTRREAGLRLNRQDAKNAKKTYSNFNRRDDDSIHE